MWRIKTQNVLLSTLLYRCRNAIRYYTRNYFPGLHAFIESMLSFIVIFTIHSSLWTAIKIIIFFFIVFKHSSSTRIIMIRLWFIFSVVHRRRRNRINHNEFVPQNGRPFEMGLLARTERTSCRGRVVAYWFWSRVRRLRAIWKVFLPIGTRDKSVGQVTFLICPHSSTIYDFEK